MTSLWGTEWSEPWGVGTPWATRDDAGELVAIDPGDLDTIDTARARVWDQFKRTTLWVRLHEVIGAVFGDVEIVAGQVDRERYVGTAIGAALDEIGALVNLPRAGTTSDDDYRLAIRAECATLLSNGTGPEVLEVARTLAPTGATVRVVEAFPAAFYVVISGLDQPRFDLIRSIMADMPSAGIGRLLLTWPAGGAGGPGWSGSDLTGEPMLGSWGWGDNAEIDLPALWAWAGELA